MILRTRAGDVELRSEFGSWPIPRSYSVVMSQAGVAVTQTEVFGLPAVSSVIRSPAEIIASLPFVVYRQGDVRERAPQTWQYELLHDRPSDERDSYEFFYDLVLSLEATQNAFVQKIGGGGRRLFGLTVLDPHRVTARVDRSTGEKLFDVMVSPSDVRKDLTPREILHVRGFCPQPGGAMGISLVQLHRDPLGAAIAMQHFEGDYFRNSALSPLVLNLGPTGSLQKATELLDAWDLQHKGAGNQFRIGAIWGETTLEKVPLSMKDATFVEAKRLSLEDVCRMWSWPPWMLGIPDDQAPDVNGRMSEFLRVKLLPRLRRIERAFAADEDLFWQSGLFGEFLTAALERADFPSRIRAYKDAIQGGHATPNETRQPENLPPHPDGDRLQFPIVGGGPVNRAAREIAARAQNGREVELELEELVANE